VSIGRRLTPTRLRAVLESAALETRYQPIVRLSDGAATGLEALARLAFPGWEILGPDEFVPYVEDAGLVAEFTDRVALRALGDMAAFGEAAARVTLLINYPLDVLLVPEALERLEQRRADAGIDPSRLMIELTERHTVTDMPALARAMESVLGAGCRLALDDVVPELPGLEALIDLPFAALKIDRSIVHGARRKGPARDFILRIGTHARANGQKLIAEGIEDQTGWDLARDLGFDAIQGFLVSRPMAAVDVPNWLRDRT
jgi:EAL domain-containing protein (putative c-di-GMP-specific phosphodiesterase class I)